MKRKILKKAIISASCGLLMMSSTVDASTVELIDKSNDGVPGNYNGTAASNIPSSTSYDGRYVLFTSPASNLVPDDIVGSQLSPYNDAFVYDRYTETIRCASIDNNGLPANDSSTAYAISGDGRYVLFVSQSPSLLPEGLGIAIFLRDMETDTVEIVSKASDGRFVEGYGGTMTPDARYIVFGSQDNSIDPMDDDGWGWDLFIHDRQTGITEMVNVDNWGQDTGTTLGSLHFSVSADGRYIAFEVYGALLPDDTNDKNDIYVRDQVANTVQMISLKSNGEQSDANSIWPAISGNGIFVAFASGSALIPEDINAVNDIYVRNIETGSLELVSVASDGTIGCNHSNYPSISYDGRYITFNTDCATLTNEPMRLGPYSYIHDRETGQTEWVETPERPETWSLPGWYQGSSYSSISPNGQVVVYGATKNFYAYNRSGIEFTETLYDYINDELNVVATSEMGADANLEVDGFGPMTWNPVEQWWEFMQGEVNTPPLFIKICDENDWCNIIR